MQTLSGRPESRENNPWLRELAELFSHQEVLTFLSAGQERSAPPLPRLAGQGGARGGAALSLREMETELESLRTVAEVSRAQLEEVEGRIRDMEERIERERQAAAPPAMKVPECPVCMEEMVPSPL